MRVLVPARRSEPEWMDRPDNPPAAIEGALRDIAIVNRLLGGRRALLGALEPYLLTQRPGEVLEVLDVGAGGGDLPAAMVREGRRLGKPVRVVALDRDHTSGVEAARATAGLERVSVVRADALALPFREKSFDLVTASMFLHHFGQREVAALLASFLKLARRAVLVNDLRRHFLPWVFIGLAARITRRHPTFAHDAPLSVLKGFTRDELLGAADRSGAKSAQVIRRWPFRLVLTLPADGASA